MLPGLCGQSCVMQGTYKIWHNTEHEGPMQVRDVEMSVKVLEFKLRVNPLLIIHFL